MYILQWGEFCLNWVGCKILSLFPGTQHSVKQKINTTYLLSNVSVLNLGSLQTPIFDLQEATIMASGVFLNISPTQVTPKHLSNIHPKRQSLKTKEVVLLMGTLYLISKTQKRETSMNISCVLSRTVSQVLVWVELINLLMWRDVILHITSGLCTEHAHCAGLVCHELAKMATIVTLAVGFVLYHWVYTGLPIPNITWC